MCQLKTVIIALAFVGFTNALRNPKNRIFDEVFYGPTFAPQPAESTKHCGTVARNYGSKISAITGEVLDHPQFPWLVEVVLSTPPEQRSCWGSLIHSQAVLVSEVCIQGVRRKYMYVMVGGFKYDGSINKYRHTMFYVNGIKRTRIATDYTIILLSGQVNVQDQVINTVCLPDKTNIVSSRSDCFSIYYDENDNKEKVIKVSLFQCYNKFSKASDICVNNAEMLNKAAVGNPLYCSNDKRRYFLSDFLGQ